MEDCQQFISHILHMCRDETAHIIYQVIFTTMIFFHQMYLCIACIINKIWEIMYDIVVTFHIHFIITIMSKHDRNHSVKNTAHMYRTSVLLILLLIVEFHSWDYAIMLYVTIRWYSNLLRCRFIEIPSTNSITITLL